MWQMEFLHPAKCHDHDIDFITWLHPAMWYLALESWQWIHQVAAPCNVIRGLRMTCHWICPVAASCNVTRSSGIMTLNLPGGSTLQCGRWLWDNNAIEFAQTSAILEFYIWFRFRHHRSRHVILHSLLNFIQIGPPLAEKNEVILDFIDPIMGSLKSPITTY